MTRAAPGTLTGRKVAIIAAASLGVAVAANVALAIFAVRTFSGLVVANGYVASQDFDRLRAAQEALGWEGGANHDGFLPKSWLRSKANSIEGGTSEIMLNIIAKHLLGLPG